MDRLGVEVTTRSCVLSLKVYSHLIQYFRQVVMYSIFLEPTLQLLFKEFKKQKGFKNHVIYKVMIYGRYFLSDMGYDCD